MIRYEKEIICGFNKLLDVILNNDAKPDIYKLVYEDKIIDAEFVTMFETDNGYDYEEDDPNYEEFNAIDFKNIETGEEFVVDYKSMPKEIWCKGTRIL